MCTPSDTTNNVTRSSDRECSASYTFSLYLHLTIPFFASAGNRRAVHQTQFSPPGSSSLGRQQEHGDGSFAFCPAARKYLFQFLHAGVLMLLFLQTYDLNVFTRTGTTSPRQDISMRLQGLSVRLSE